jgi:hypothetical protein
VDTKVLPIADIDSYRSGAGGARPDESIRVKYGNLNRWSFECVLLVGPACQIEGRRISRIRVPHDLQCVIGIFERSDQVFLEGPREICRILDQVTLNGCQLRLQVKVETQPNKGDHRQPKKGRALVESAKPGLSICERGHGVPWLARLGGSMRFAAFRQVNGNGVREAKML